MSVIMAGIRNALVVGIGITAIGAFIGAGGLGESLFAVGMQQTVEPSYLPKRIPTASMAILMKCHSWLD